MNCHWTIRLANCKSSSILSKHKMLTIYYIQAQLLMEHTVQTSNYEISLKLRCELKVLKRK